MDLYTFRAVCTNVVDGDTVDCVIDAGFQMTTTQRLRLLRVNTPERGQEGYDEATEFTANIILGREVFVKTYKDDVFGRYLAEIYVTLGDELLCLNDLLLDSGFAVPYKKK